MQQWGKGQLESVQQSLESDRFYCIILSILPLYVDRVSINKPFLSVLPLTKNFIPLMHTECNNNLSLRTDINMRPAFQIFNKNV